MYSGAYAMVESDSAVEHLFANSAYIYNIFQSVCKGESRRPIYVYP